MSGRRRGRRLVIRNGTPLTSVPDPFGGDESFGAANNARLRGFLDQFGFDYEFSGENLDVYSWLERWRRPDPHVGHL